MSAPMATRRSDGDAVRSYSIKQLSIGERGNRMAGKVKRIIDEIISQRSGGNPTFMMTTKTKLILKGINPDKFTASAEDDPVMIQKVLAVAKDMGVKL